MYLNCHSYYSLRYGTLSIQQLVEEAVTHQVSYLGLTDIHCTTGVFDFVKACEEQGIKPIVGIEFIYNNLLIYIALAKNFEGLHQINNLMTQSNLGEGLIPKQHPQLDQCFIIYPTNNIPVKLADNEYVGITLQDLKRYKNPALFSYKKLIALHTVTHKNETDYELHKLLRCVEHNILYAKLGDYPYAAKSEYMLPLEQFIWYYRSFPEIIENTHQLAKQCDFQFDFKTLKNKKTFTGNHYEDKMLLETLAREGFRRRYSKDDKVALDRLESELDVIDKLQFACYFLTTWDIVRYSLHHDFFHVGRGSGANSLVAYCLRITEVDPLELNLYFARFLNTKRSSPPDFDIDWSWKDRDQIINYIFKRFGREYTGFCGTVTDFKYRSIVRELGKVYGLPKEELDILSRNRVVDSKNSIASTIQIFGEMLQGFPNQYSMHSCGIFISDKPISYYSIMNVYQKGVPTCEIDMYIADDINLQKLDILSQRGLGTIKDSIDLIKKNQNIEVDISQVKQFQKDEKCNELLAKGKTLGCFYIESPAMRGLLRRLKCNNYETLVAASSIIRPGVAQSGMMREYVERHRDPSKTVYFHQVFEDQLKDTYGVMVYQEDVIKIAHHFANMDLDDADMLRRGMSGKSRGKKELELIKNRYFDNCKALGYPEELTNEVYRQIASFAGYSFCKSHSASYAVESYQSLYLKTYYPLEFITAVINNHGGFYRQEVYINEAKQSGAKVEAPDVNYSEEFASIDGEVIHLGLNVIMHVTKFARTRIPQNRLQNGRYDTLEELIDRTKIGKEDVEQLIYVGALRSISTSKMELIVLTKRLFNHQQKGEDNAVQLFNAVPRKQIDFPAFNKNPLEDIFDELEGLGFPVSISPFDLLKTNYRGAVMVENLLQYVNKMVKMVGYLVSIKDVPIKKKGRSVKMNFGTWIDVNGDYFDTVHFPQSLVKYPFKGLGCYLLLGRVVVDFDFPSVEITKMARLPMVDDPRYKEVDEKGMQALTNLPVAHSKTERAPYPDKEELDQLYGRSNSTTYPLVRSSTGRMSLGNK